MIAWMNELEVTITLFLGKFGLILHFHKRFLNVSRQKWFCLLISNVLEDKYKIFLVYRFILVFQRDVIGKPQQPFIVGIWQLLATLWAAIIKLLQIRLNWDLLIYFA